MKYICFVFLLSVGMNAFSGTMLQANIDKMMIDSANGNMIFIKASGSGYENPSCATNGTWQFILPLTTELQKQQMTSFLLSAYVAGKKVRLVGTGTCDTYSSIETLRRIEFEF